jgi:hypothetical protein
MSKPVHIVYALHDQALRDVMMEYAQRHKTEVNMASRVMVTNGLDYLFRVYSPKDIEFVRGLKIVGYTLHESIHSVDARWLNEMNTRVRLNQIP